MLPCNVSDAAEGQEPRQGNSLTHAVISSTQTRWSPAVSPRAHSFDEIIPHRPHQPRPSSAVDIQRLSQSSPSQSSARVASPVSNSPQAILDMSLIQARAEMLEMQMRRDREETQRMTERHFAEMLDSKGFRVTHACEHCRQRKAKCSGQQPCQRCAKQGILCVYSRQERRARIVGPGPIYNPIDVPSQSSRLPTMGSGYAFPPSDASMPGGGPMRMERNREARYSNLSVPYGLRRNTAPSAQLQYLPATREDAPFSSSLPPLPPPATTSRPSPQHQKLAVSGSWPPLPPTMRELKASSHDVSGQPSVPTQMLRPTPLRYSSHTSFEERPNLNYADVPQPPSHVTPRPWTSEGSSRATDNHPSTYSTRADSQAHPPSRFPPVMLRAISRLSTASGLTRPVRPSPSFPLNKGWSEVQETAPAEISTMRAVTAHPELESTHQPVHTIQPVQVVSAHSLQNEASGLHEEWSLDTALSNQAQRGSLSTEGGQSHGSNMSEAFDRDGPIIAPDQEQHVNETGNIDQTSESQRAQYINEGFTHS